MQAEIRHRDRYNRTEAENERVYSQTTNTRSYAHAVMPSWSAEKAILRGHSTTNNASLQKQLTMLAKAHNSSQPWALECDALAQA